MSIQFPEKFKVVKCVMSIFFCICILYFEPRSFSLVFSTSCIRPTAGLCIYKVHRSGHLWPLTSNLIVNVSIVKWKAAKGIMQLGLKMCTEPCNMCQQNGRMGGDDVTLVGLKCTLGTVVLDDIQLLCHGTRDVLTDI